MTHLAIGAVAFAIGLRLGYWFGRDDGYHWLAMRSGVTGDQDNPKYRDIIRAAKQSAERELMGQRQTVLTMLEEAAGNGVSRQPVLYAACLPRFSARIQSSATPATRSRKSRWSRAISFTGWSRSVPPPPKQTFLVCAAVHGGADLGQSPSTPGAGARRRSLPLPGNLLNSLAHPLLSPGQGSDGASGDAADVTTIGRPEQTRRGGFFTSPPPAALRG